MGRTIPGSVAIHGNLQLDIAGTSLIHTVEGGLGIGHHIGVGDERLEVQFTAGDQVNGLLIDVRVTEHILDAYLGRLQLGDVDAHGIDRDADEDGGTARRDELEEGLVGMLKVKSYISRPSPSAISVIILSISEFVII